MNGKDREIDISISEIPKLEKKDGNLSVKSYGIKGFNKILQNSDNIREIIPQEVLDLWLMYYKRWSEENGEIPEFDTVDEVLRENVVRPALLSVYKRAKMYADFHNLEFKGEAFFKTGYVI
jgi:hypothetical protein